MPPLTMQAEGLTKGTSCPSHCPMLGASCSSFKLKSGFPVLLRRTVQVKNFLAGSRGDLHPEI